MRNSLDPNWRESPTTFSNSFKVERVTETGDLLVVNAARASFGTSKKKLDPKDLKLLSFLCREKHINPFYHFRAAFKWDHVDEMFFFDRHDAAGYDFDKEARIMTMNVYNDPQTFLNLYGPEKCLSGKLLLDHGHRGQHWQDLEEVKIDPQSPASWRTVRICCPIPIARQWFKSKIGADESEESRRYIKTDPEFFIPDTFRMGSEDVKQGSSSTPFEPSVLQEIETIYASSIERTREAYCRLLELGLCAEQARFVLPQAMMTTFVDTMSVRTLRRMYKLRAASDAQKEINKLINEVIEKCQVSI